MNSTIGLDIQQQQQQQHDDASPMPQWPLLVRLNSASVPQQQLSMSSSNIVRLFTNLEHCSWCRTSNKLFVAVVCLTGVAHLANRWALHLAKQQRAEGFIPHEMLTPLDIELIELAGAS